MKRLGELHSTDKKQNECPGGYNKGVSLKKEKCIIKIKVSLIISHIVALYLTLDLKDESFESQLIKADNICDDKFGEKEG